DEATWGGEEAQTTAGWMTTPTREKTTSANRGREKEKGGAGYGGGLPGHDDGDGDGLRRLQE
ncbi:hypothetical protein E2562_005609, partial [Oryza meyeriana var. granulata]